MNTSRRAFPSVAFVLSACLSLVVTASVSLLMAAPALAQSAAPTNSAAAAKTSGAATGVFLPFGNVSLPTLIGRIIRYAAGLVGVIALLMFIYAGALYMTAQGDDEKVQKAKDIMLWSVLGIVAVLGAYGLVRLIYSVVDVAGL